MHSLCTFHLLFTFASIDNACVCVCVLVTPILWTWGNIQKTNRWNVGVLSASSMGLSDGPLLNERRLPSFNSSSNNCIISSTFIGFVGVSNASICGGVCALSPKRIVDVVFGELVLLELDVDIGWSYDSGDTWLYTGDCVSNWYRVSGMSTGATWLDSGDDDQ